MRGAFIDGLTYVGIALLGYVIGQLSSDDAAKYVDAQFLFWLKMGVGSSSAGLIALKMFRSTSYADAKSGSGKTETKP